MDQSSSNLTEEDDTSTSNSSMASIPSDFILEGFLDDNEGTPEEHAKLVRFYKLVIDREQPVTDDDYERLDAVGVQFTR